jgi:DNA adenine methylase
MRKISEFHYKLGGPNTWLGINSPMDQKLSDTLVLPSLGLDGSEPLVKPFLRWAGGKTRLLKTILPFVPTSFNNYYEPFLGSGAMFFGTRARARGGYFLSDLNEELINLYQIVRDNPRKLQKELSKYDGKDTEDEYYLVRETSPRGSIQRAARFFYLNQTAWNGLWRVNRWGVFNVPWGARPFRGIEEATLLATSDALQAASIDLADFRQILSRPKRGDFVYLDPPYLPVSDTSKFSGYTEQRFRLADLKELACCCEDLSKRGVTWILSNRDTPVVRELFAHARIIPFTTRRSVAAQNRRNVQPSQSPEVIIVGGANN